MALLHNTSRFTVSQFLLYAYLAVPPFGLRLGGHLVVPRTRTSIRACFKKNSSLHISSEIFRSTFLLLYVICFCFVFCILHGSLNLDVVSLVIRLIVFCCHLLHSCLLGHP